MASAIKVKHCHGLFMVWNVDDVIRLRTEHRIVGNLVGALPEFPRQHSDYGLPLVLMIEEVRLLSQLSVISLVEEPNDMSHLKTDDCQSFYQELESKHYEQINSKFKEGRKAEIEANLDKIVQGKIKKAQLNFDNSPEKLAQFRAKISSELIESIQDVPKSCNSSLTPFYIETPYPQVPCSAFHLPAIEPLSLEAIKLAVFEDFWHKGYYLTNGIKFGAHFLAYDNDPIAFHAKYLVICARDSASYDHFENDLLQAYGRLGKNVRKNVILAHFDQSPQSSTTPNDKPTISYKHIQWNPTGLA